MICALTDWVCYYTVVIEHKLLRVDWDSHGGYHPLVGGGGGGGGGAQRYKRQDERRARG